MDRRLFLATVGLGAAGAAVTGGFSASGTASGAGRSPGRTPSRSPSARRPPRHYNRPGPAESVAPLQLAAQTYDYPDFTEATSERTCAVLAGGIIGQGSDRTIIDLTGPITTPFPHFTLGNTTQWNVIRIQSSIGRLTKPVLTGFTLRITAPFRPGQLFNGLRIANADDLLIEDVQVVGVAGTGNLPPFETFGIDLINCARPVLRRVAVDGRRRGGAGIGLNLTSDAVLDTCTSTHNRFSHGFTVYGCERVRFTNCVSEHNGKGKGRQSGVGFNHEETDTTVHYRSRSAGNSLASFRYWSAGASSTEHQIISSYGDGAVLIQGTQSPGDVAIANSRIVGGIATG